MRHYIHPQPRLPRKERPPRFLPFKVGDRVVNCSHRSLNTQRGTTGTIYNIVNHLDVWVSFDKGVCPFKKAEDVPVDKNGGIPNQFAKNGMISDKQIGALQKLIHRFRKQIGKM